jgi:hypothetical protein
MIMLELLPEKTVDTLENESSVTQATEDQKPLVWFNNSHAELWRPAVKDDTANEPEEPVEEEEDNEQPAKSSREKRGKSKTGDRKTSDLPQKPYQMLKEHMGFQYVLGSMAEWSKRLALVKILVLGAPQELLSQSEIDEIIEFVHEGGGVLIANTYNSLFEQERKVYDQDQNPPQLEEDEKYSTNHLMEAFGLRFKRLLSYPPDDIAQFEPHYMSTDINKIFLREPGYLEILSEMPETILGSPQVVAKLPDTDEIFLVGVEAKYGRVAAIADCDLFTDEYLNYGNHRQLLDNIIQWLAAENPIDCAEATIAAEIVKGQAAVFGIKLKNSRQQRLEYIDCLLESNVNVEIREPRQQVRSIGPFHQTQLQWTVMPQQLGVHQLRLTIEIAKGKTLFFDIAAQFECVPDGEFDLVVLDEGGAAKGMLEVGKPYEVMAVLKKTVAIPDTEVQLQSDSRQLQIEPLQMGMQRWRLNALDAGTMPITLRMGKSERQSSYLLQVADSAQGRIERVERDVMQPLLAQLQYQVSQMDQRFDSESIHQIPCRIYTPEAHIRRLNSPEAAEQKLEALRVARRETRSNRPLMEYLLGHLAPTFSPIEGCCIPYDPDLARDLGQRHRNFAEGWAQNLLIATGEEERLPQNLAALIVHEKYGHGFFFNHTTLGRQLAILYRHGMTRNADLKSLKSPYPRSLYFRYRKAIQALWDSAVIVNEGFAAWLEVTVLTRMGGVMAEAAYRRRSFLFEDNGLAARAKKSDYFAEFPPFRSSRYREGCEYLQKIQDWFGEDGFRWAIAAFVKAADVDLGIVEFQQQVQFALEPEVMEAALLHADKHDARADQRLQAIFDLLQESAETLRSTRKWVKLEEKLVQFDELVGLSMCQKLGW